MALVAGCANAPESTSPIPGPEQVFTFGYQRISELYLRPVDLGQLTLAGLRGLSSIDRELTAERGRAGIRLAHSDGTTISVTVPGTNDPQAWARSLTTAVESARRAFSSIRSSSMDDIYEAVFDGLVDSLDEHSHYHGPERATDERAQREGRGGVGVSLRPALGSYAITQVVPQSPAAIAGIRVGDRLVAVGGERTESMSAQAVRDRLAGAIDSEVVLTLMREGVTRQTSIRRQRVVPNTVSAELIDNIVVVRIERFNAATVSRVQQAIRDFHIRNGGLRGLIMDVRDNPGGLLDQAVATADLFLKAGRIVSTRGRHPESIQHFDATEGDILDGLPIVVLVDGLSASAAEVVAAALQDDGRAVIVGSASLGKGSVQTVTRLPNDAEILLTWSRLYAPSGYTLHNIGVLPTVCTSIPGSTLNTIMAGMRDGTLVSPAAYAAWRSAQVDDDTTVQRLTAQCPREPQRREDVDIDLEVAKRLIGNRTLYSQAITAALPPIVQSNLR